MHKEQIEKKILLHSSRQSIWRALSDSTEFGKWFGMKFDGTFAPGVILHGVTVPTTVNAEIAEIQRRYEGTPVEIRIELMLPERLFSFRWRPYSTESAEPATLIVFAMEEVEGGIMLTVTESGFEKMPAEHRAKAMAMNSQGWDMTMQLIGEHLTQANAN